MKTIDLMNELAFGDQGPYAQQLSSDQIGKIVRYMLEPGQEMEETHAPFMPRYFIVLQGEGSFSSENGEEKRVGPNTVVIFNPKEKNKIRALEEPLVVIGFLYWATGG